MNEFGPEGKRLVWEPQDIGKKATFLDLTITLRWDGGFDTKTYQKAMNLYLYRMPTSAQPPHIHYGLIYGSLHRYYWQNTNKKDFLKLVNLLAKRLFARGHSFDTLQKHFNKAADQLLLSKPAIPKLGPKNNNDESTGDTIFIHLPYHPQDPPRKRIQQLFKEFLLPILQKYPNGGLERAVVAYSNLPTIGNYVKKNRLEAGINTKEGSAN